MNSNDIADAILLVLFALFGFAVGSRLQWLEIAIVSILLFLYFYPTIRNWF